MGVQITSKTYKLASHMEEILVTEGVPYARRNADPRQPRNDGETSEMLAENKH